MNPYLPNEGRKKSFYRDNAFHARPNIKEQSYAIRKNANR